MKVWIGNWGKYNEGELQGDWIKLPVTKAELDNFLRDKVGLQLTPKEAHEFMRNNKVGYSYEMYYIGDYETELSCWNFNEFENLDRLNLLAAYEEKANNIEAVNEYCNSCGIEDIEGICNVIMQEDDIEIIPLCEGSNNLSSSDAIIGFTLAEQYEIKDRLAAAGLEDYMMYFDYEAYGRDCSINQSLVLLSNGIIDVNSSAVVEDLYTYDELLNDVEDIIKPNDVNNDTVLINEKDKDPADELFD